MSEIDRIIERLEWQADRAYFPSQYQLGVALLQALNVLADRLEVIADKLGEISREDKK